MMLDRLMAPGKVFFYLAGNSEILTSISGKAAKSIQFVLIKKAVRYECDVSLRTESFVKYLV